MIRLSWGAAPSEPSASASATAAPSSPPRQVDAGEAPLDDAGFAERFARSRLARHGLGRLRVRQGLRQRGAERGVAEAGLRAALREVPEAEVLDALARRYWRQHTRDEPPHRLRKLWAFLLRRGFPAPLVGARLRALWPRWRDAIEGLEPVEESQA